MVSTPEVTWLASKAKLSPADFAVRFDKVLDRRNNSAAHRVLLEEEVECCRELLTALPDLRTKHRWEAWVIDIYTELAAAFPLRFA